MYRIFFIPSSVDRHLGCFHVLAIVNLAAVNIGVHVSFQIMVFSGYMPRSGIAGSYGSCIFSFFKEPPYCMLLEKWTLLHCLWECKLVQSWWRTVWRFLKKLHIELPYVAAIPLLGIYLEKTIIQKDTCTPMFTAALFTIAKTWKQPKCLSTEEWIKKMWYIYTR